MTDFETLTKVEQPGWLNGWLPGVTPRPYQVEAVEAVERDLPEHGSVLIVIPTGTGKTVVGSEVVRRYVGRRQRVLWLAHRRELIEQAATKLREFGLKVGIERGKYRSNGEPVVVASVQTLRGSRLWNIGDFDLIVIDECHHAPSVSYCNITDYFPLAHILGVTATPDRLDRVGLCTMFNKVSYHMTLRRAIAEGWLTPINAKRVTVEGMDLSKVRSRAGDLRPDDLHDAVIPPQAIDGITGPLLSLAGEKKTVVFAVDVGHSKALADKLNLLKPGSAASVDGSMHDDDRKGVIQRFVSGEIQFLINCQILVEGWDCPEVECVAMCRPTQSRAWYTQGVGRGLRLSPGKTECLLLDFAGVGAKHSLVGPEDVLGLPRPPKDDVKEWQRLEKTRKLGRGSQETVMLVGQPQVTSFDPLHIRVMKKVGGWFDKLLGV